MRFVFPVILFIFWAACSNSEGVSSGNSSNIEIEGDPLVGMLRIKAVGDTVLLGTQGYAAPEQYGFGASNVQTDIYAVGVPSILMMAIGSVMTYCMNMILKAFSSTAIAVFGAYFKLHIFKSK